MHAHPQPELAEHHRLGVRLRPGDEDRGSGGRRHEPEPPRIGLLHRHDRRQLAGEPLGPEAGRSARRGRRRRRDRAHVRGGRATHQRGQDALASQVARLSVGHSQLRQSGHCTPTTTTDRLILVGRLVRLRDHATHPTATTTVTDTIHSAAAHDYSRRRLEVHA